MKRKLKRKYKIMISILFIFVILGIGYLYFTPQLKIKTNKVEINEEITIKDIIENPKIKIANKKLDTKNLGSNSIVVEYKNHLGQTINKKLNYQVIDTKAPEISYDKKITTKVGNDVDLLANVEVRDNSLEDIKAQVEGEYDINKEGTYNLKYVAWDKSKNKTEEEFTLIVTSNVIAQTQDNETKQKTDNKNPYLIKINREQNVVMVYGLENGEYTKLVKVFTCSTGPATPVGTFQTSDKYVWRPLFGDVYGQYATRITGSILFHSVPYTKQSKDSLEWEEYNKLGTAASMGCIRLRVVDVKWIYDNCPKGTTVIIYDSESLDGIEKPVIKNIDVNSPNRDWDPTDPDPLNPWN